MIAQSVADIVNGHVKLSVEGIDRMYLNVYVPRLQREPGVVWFFREHRGQPLPSAALMRPISRGFVSALEDFAAQHEIPVVQFRKGRRKDQVMAEHLRHFRHDEGVVFVGKAQEKTTVFRTGKTAIDQKEAVAAMLEKFEICCGLFHGFDYSKWVTGKAQERLSSSALRNGIAGGPASLTRGSCDPPPW